MVLMKDNNSIRAVLHVVLPKALAASGTILLSLLIPVVFGVEEASNLFLGISILYFFGIVCRGGMDVWLLREKSKCESDSAMVITSNDILCLFICLLSSALVGILYTIYYYGDGRYSWVFFTLPAFSGLGLLSFYIRGIRKEAWASSIEVGIVSLLVFLILGIAEITELSISITALFVLCAWGLFFLNIIFLLKLGKIKFTRLEIPVREVFGYLGIQLVSYLSQWLPIFLLAKFDSSHVVFFALANRLGGVLVFVGAAIDSYVAPRYSNYSSSGDYQALARFRSLINRYSFFISIVSFLCICLFSVTYGFINNYGAEFYIFVVFLLVCYAGVVAFGPNGYCLLMAGAGGVVFRNTLLFFCLSSSFAVAGYYLRSPFLMLFSVGGVILIRQYCLRLKVNKFLKEKGV